MDSEKIPKNNFNGVYERTRGLASLAPTQLEHFPQVPLSQTDMIKDLETEKTAS